MMFNGDDDGDLMSLVRSCSGEKGKAPDSSTYPPPPAAVAPPPLPTPNPTRTDDSWQPTIFPNPSAYFGGLEEVLMPFFPQPPQPQQPAGGGVVPTATRTPRTPKQAPTRASKRKNQQKKVVTQVPVDNSTSNDNWAWRKYGQKPIKGSPYPRGYYRCSTSKSCPARKQVERSRTDPGMLIVSYAEEHNHPLPTHRNSLAGMTRNKYSASSSEAAEGAGLPSGLSPTTPLTTSQSMEEEEEEEEEEDDEGMELDVGDIEVVGDDELVFMGDATMPKAPAAVPYSLLFYGAEDACFSKIWSGNNGGNKPS